MTNHPSASESGELNNGMHDSIFVKVWGDAGGGDAGRRALAQYAFDLGRATQPVAAPIAGDAPAALFADAVARLAAHDHDAATVLAHKYRAALANQPAPTVPREHAELLGSEIFELATPYFAWNAGGWQSASQGTVGMPQLLDFTRAAIVADRAAVAAKIRPDAMSQPSEAAPLDAYEMTRLRRLMKALGHFGAFDQPDEFVRGILCTVLGQAAGVVERALANQPAPTVPTRAAFTTDQIDQLAELHFYAPDADSMAIRLRRFASALTAALAHQPAQEQADLQYRTCCDHPDCTTCAGHGGFYRLAAPQAPVAAAPDALSIPDVLFDGNSVYDEIVRKIGKAYCGSPSVVADTLDAVVRLLKQKGAVTNYGTPVAAPQQAAAPRTDLSKRIREAATADVTLAQAKLLIGAAEEIERWAAQHEAGDDDADDLRTAVARAIWDIRREDEDRCDMELEDMGEAHSVWEEADAVLAVIAASPVVRAQSEESEVKS